MDKRIEEDLLKNGPPSTFKSVPPPLPGPRINEYVEHRNIRGEIDPSEWQILLDNGSIDLVSKTHLLPNWSKEAMLNLRDSGFNPRVIYDIGSCALHWAAFAHKVWPEAKIYLFEANAGFKPVYDIICDPEVYRYTISMLSDVSGKVVNTYINTDVSPILASTSYYKEIGLDCEKFPTTTESLDVLCKLENYPPPNLIKLDTQGSELDILKGGENILEKTSYIFCELSTIPYNEQSPLAEEVYDYLRNKNYNLLHRGYFIFMGERNIGQYDAIFKLKEN